MTILLLDARWPTMMPIAARGRILRPVSFSMEVPVSLRWNVDDVVDGDDPHGVGTFITCNEEVAQRVYDDAAEAGQYREIVRSPSLDDPLLQARAIMSRARSVGQWEARQTHESLLPFLVEETGEFAEAVRNDASDATLVKELGDIFLQVLFHAEIADRRSAFDLDDVAASFIAKMRSRAPYLFDGSTSMVDALTQDELWQAGKLQESGESLDDETGEREWGDS
ncbi:MazG nucleotide pyrophosphohydrolase domain-containing protein [Corynebacterium uterequi]|uniref:MazG nucleotide pyrophosphohydrolase family protein n=1 Tax=Corynebacterium uterequi TaxID=1072256 RepID=A0A0G3HBI9_9CORY|nr:MazG nucleotide pyrophosphohydrolase domain-containing protein [Corynebacterium uterequi]AKK10756.1 MazG nucleotide pyrophosphohydrolase family protein [Corynebacterium uterequi]